MQENQEWELDSSLVSRTLTNAPDFPQGLFERLKYTAEVVAQLDTSRLSGAYLARCKDSAGVELYPLERAQTVVGRSEDADLSVSDDKNLSRRHFLIRRDGGCYSVEDLGSTNGTSVNGVALSAQQVLRSGDLIEAGARVYVFLVADPED